MLYEKIHEDLKAAIKSRSEFDLGVLRMLSAALHNREIEKRTSGQSPTLTEQDVLDVLTREAKKRKDAAALYLQGGRKELEEKELKEVTIIQKYLPAQVSAEEIEAVVKRVIASGAKDFGSAMREAMKEMRGRADGKAVGEAVKKLLA